MIYGTYSKAKEYMDRGEIALWLQLFLRNDGKNTALADGLLLEERHYVGLRRIPISLLKGVKSGTPEYLHDKDSIDYFFYIVDRMKANSGHWDVPPLIVEFTDGTFRVNDGRHRLEMYRQLEAREIDVVLWATGERDYKKLLEVLSC